MNSDTHLEFYRRLGHLFYAIAATDNGIKDEEFKILETLVYKDWLSENEDAKSILETFKHLQANEAEDSNTYFQHFVDFKRAHYALFNKTINSKILNTATAITTSFSGQNKSELILLAKLDIELKK
ncbi:hypothetical protein ADIWIN_1445 [Winogradskyella psychrotolerans RS-3]|uniref:Co-chaperone DjlA N-terminal domain-containing protein n=1 Tax=Winogradskyella psychrotolerans RS-3 TaxID=641526 RepID=S7VT37_9FLAO|nr:hypothetical protein [Winogradskyella psychrotolerans]EPR73415.1 hypothetical protein ADIWIN_1445 [Winogradskyella psychrotolerans RS-3]